MNITITYWDDDSIDPRSITYQGDPKEFHIWLKGVLSTGVFVTKVTY